MNDIELQYEKYIAAESYKISNLGFRISPELLRKFMPYTVYREWIGIAPANRVTKVTGIWVPLFMTLYCGKSPFSAGFRRAVQRIHVVRFGNA